MLLWLISGLCFSLSLSTSSLSLSPTLVGHLSQREAEVIRHPPVHYYSSGGRTKASQNGRAHRALWIPGARAILGSKRKGGRALSPVAFSGLLHMKHCHAPAASLKPKTSKNLTSSRWSCTWSRSCSGNTEHKELIS